MRTLAKSLGRKPRELAQGIVERLDYSRAGISSAEIAGPGFINFRVSTDVFAEGLRALIAAADRYGRSNAGESCLVNVEFVTASGRSAALVTLNDRDVRPDAPYARAARHPQA